MAAETGEDSKRRSNLAEW